MKFKNWIKSFLAGAAMGIASAIPGVSGGTIAVIVGVYQKLIDAINNLFKKFINSFLTLLPIGLGVLCAMIPCLLLFDIALEGFVFGIVSLFAGFIIGSFKDITKEVSDKKPEVIHIIICVITCLIAIGLGVLSSLTGDSLDISGQFANPKWWLYLVLIPVGVLAAISLVIPGISGSMLLLVLGFYKPIIGLVSDLLKNILDGNLSTIWQSLGLLGCFGLGVVIGFFTVAKLMSFLLAKHRRITFYGIIGFIIGSTIALYCNYEIVEYYQMWASGKQGFLPMWAEIVVGVILLIVGTISTLLIGHFSKKQKENNLTEN